MCIGIVSTYTYAAGSVQVYYSISHSFSILKDQFLLCIAPAFFLEFVLKKMLTHAFYTVLGLAVMEMRGE